MRVALLTTFAASRPGAKKPALERVFKPMGYSVSGGTGSAAGSFTPRRRTSAI